MAPGDEGALAAGEVGADLHLVEPGGARPGRHGVGLVGGQLDDEGARRLSTGAVVATDGRRKLLRRDGHELLFDLAADPLELSGRVLGAAESDVDVQRLRRAAAAAETPSEVPGGRATTPFSACRTPSWHHTDETTRTMVLARANGTLSMTVRSSHSTSS